MTVAVIGHTLPSLPAAKAAAEASLDEEELQHYTEADPQAFEALCSALAAAVVLREPFAPSAAAAAAALPGVTSLSLALPVAEGHTLLHLPVLESGRWRQGPLEPAGGELAPGTAAWEAFVDSRSLLWVEGAAPPYPDWQRALVEASEGGAQPAALLTVPICPGPGGGGALGAATFGLAAPPEAAEEQRLEALGRYLARSILHHTKSLWEDSLGFLASVMPRPVVQRMLSAAIRLGPLAAVEAAPAPEAAAAAAAAAAEAVGGGGGRGGGLSQPATPAACDLPELSICAWGRAATPESVSPLAPSSSGPAGKAVAASAARPPADEPAPLSPSTAGRPGSEAEGCGAAPALLQAGLDTRQKWNLEYADPGLEHGFKSWFNTLQTVADLRVFRYYSALLIALFAVLAARGGLGLSDWLVLGHGVLSLAVLGCIMLLNTAWYIAHRSTIVAAVRIGSASLLLVHVYLDPAVYTGSLIKGLAGSCALNLAANSFRNRLRFSNHLLVQLANLYLCACANAFTYSQPHRAEAAYLQLAATTLAQLSAALGPSLVVFLLEARTRRKFLRARLAAAQPAALAAADASSPSCAASASAGSE